MAIEKINWLSAEEVSQLPTSEYWNDSESERKKIYNDFQQLEKNEKYNALLKQTELLCNYSKANLKGSILSLAAGSGWLECRMLKDKHFDQLTLVDFSQYRIHDLGYLTAEHYLGADSNVQLVLGNILDLKLKDESQDVVILSQAFHHVDEPYNLLKEINRVLKHNGRIVISGEHFYGKVRAFKRSLKHVIKYLMNHKDFKKDRTIVPDYTQLFPPDFSKGDHHYSKFQYAMMFKKASLDYDHLVNRKAAIQGYSLHKT